MSGMTCRSRLREGVSSARYAPVRPIPRWRWPPILRLMANLRWGTSRRQNGERLFCAWCGPRWGSCYSVRDLAESVVPDVAAMWSRRRDDACTR